MTNDRTGDALNEVVQPAPAAEVPDAKMAAIALKQSMLADIKQWSWGLLIVGTVSILLPGFLDPIWGGMLMVGGIVGFFVKRRGSFIAFGVVLILAALMNILSFEPGWIAFGALQIYWAIGEFRKYRRYAGVWAEADGVQQEPVVRVERHSRLGIASLLLSGLGVAAAVAFTVSSAVNVALSGVSPDLTTPVPVLIILIGFCCPLFLLCGVGTGIGGIAQRRRRRPLAIAGLCINVLVLALVITLLSILPPLPEAPNDGKKVPNNPLQDSDVPPHPER